MTPHPGSLRWFVCIVVSAACAVIFVSCASVQDTARDTADARAHVLADRLLVLDSHMDVPYRLMTRMVDISERTFTTDFDYVRAREGGLKVAFCAVYTPQRFEASGGSKDHALGQIALTEGLAQRWPSKFAIVTSPAEIRARLGGDHVLLALGMENGIPLEDDTANVRFFYGRGIRYITLVHTRANRLADASFDTTRPWNGLSPYGRDVVVAMNRTGMMIDVSHMSDSAFYQTVRLSRAPVVATHSSCRAFTPGFERNMSDAMIRTLGVNGGVIQINFGSMFLVDSLRQRMDKAGSAINTYLREHNLHYLDEEAMAYARRYRKEQGIPYATARDIARHIDHVVKIAGIDHVGLGSDFDGLGDDLPVDVKDVSGYPAIIRELLLLGYDDGAIAKVCGENFMRLWSDVRAVAEQNRGAGSH
jgi:membrane dipeptidase